MVNIYDSTTNWLIYELHDIHISIDDLKELLNEEVDDFRAKVHVEDVDLFHDAQCTQLVLGTYTLAQNDNLYVKIANVFGFQDSYSEVEIPYLYNRELSVLTLVATLLTDNLDLKDLKINFEKRQTPICDEGGGSGKSSLIRCSKSILKTLPQYQEDPEQFEDFMNRIYIHVDLSSCKFDENEAGSTIEYYVISLLRQAIIESATEHQEKLATRLRTNYDIFKDIEMLKQKFLFHYDHMDELADYPSHVIRMLNQGEKLEYANNYFVMTGRGRMLNLMCNNTLTYLLPAKLHRLVPVGNYESIRIPMPPLTTDQIKELINKHKQLLQGEEVNEAFVNQLIEFTGGFQEIVEFALQHLPLNEKLLALLGDRYCRDVAIGNIEKIQFRTFLRIASAKYAVCDEDMVCNEPMTCVVPKLSIYKQLLPNKRYYLIIPKFVEYKHTEGISNPEVHECIDTAFVSGLLQRSSMCRNKCSWNRMGLDFLSTVDGLQLDNVCSSLAFAPTVSNSARADWSVEEFKEIATKEYKNFSVELDDATPILNKTCSWSQLTTLFYDHMMEGVFYYSKNNSECPFSFFKSAANVIIAFQFITEDHRSPFEKNLFLIRSVSSCQPNNANLRLYVVVVDRKGLTNHYGLDLLTSIDTNNSYKCPVINLSENSLRNFLGINIYKEINTLDKIATSSHKPITALLDDIDRIKKLDAQTKKSVNVNKFIANMNIENKKVSTSVMRVYDASSDIVESKEQTPAPSSTASVLNVNTEGIGMSPPSSYETEDIEKARWRAELLKLMAQQDDIRNTCYNMLHRVQVLENCLIEINEQAATRMAVVNALRPLERVAPTTKVKHEICEFYELNKEEQEDLEFVKATFRLEPTTTHTPKHQSFWAKCWNCFKK